MRRLNRALVSLSCRKHSLMYQSRSMITVPDPLSAALMIMSVRQRSCLRTSRSRVVRLSRTGFNRCKVENVPFSLACVASVSVKQSAKNGVFGVLLARKMGREQKIGKRVLCSRTAQKRLLRRLRSTALVKASKAVSLC